MSSDEKEREIRQYVTQGRRALCRGKRLTAEFEQALRHEMESYLEENPGSTPSDVLRVFGSPEQAAEHYLDAVPAELLRADRRAQNRKYYLAVVGLVLLIALSLTAGIWAQLY